jgi:hypothetical protein
MATDYTARREANEDSLTYAERHREAWDETELELLVEGWSDDEATLPEIAELLGRTIEACRQKYYEVRRGHVRAYRAKQAKSTHNSQWDKGWTSLEDMGY